METNEVNGLFIYDILLFFLKYKLRSYGDKVL